MKYQIKDWNIHFENDRSRKRKQCSFVCVPNKQHGLGFIRIMAEPDGAAIYGVWNMIVGACSQQHKRDGWLTENGEENGTLWGAADLALKFRRPVTEIQRALDVISSKSIGWIVITASSPSNHHVITEQGTDTIPERKKEGIERKKETAEEDAATPPAGAVVEAVKKPPTEKQKAGFRLHQFHQNIETLWKARWKSIFTDVEPRITGPDYNRLDSFIELNPDIKASQIVEMAAKAWNKIKQGDSRYLIKNSKSLAFICSHYSEIESELKNENINPSGSRRTDLGAGTSNDGRQSQYAGVGKVV